MTEPASREVLDRLITIEAMLRQLVQHRDDSEIRELERGAVTRDELERQHRRTLAWVSLIVSIIGIIIGASASVIITLLA